ncbi:MAG: YfbK domain-containing protein [Hymenobacter sp.]
MCRARCWATTACRWYRPACGCWCAGCGPGPRGAGGPYAGAAGLVLPLPPARSPKPSSLPLTGSRRAAPRPAARACAWPTPWRDKTSRRKAPTALFTASDGDFNVGESSDAALAELIVKGRESGVFLTVLGVGRGNLRDSRMELLADKGNGGYAYLDNLDEARRTLVAQFGGTLFTVAKDVKLQVEFNPARVADYRLIGYELRLLANEDFNNDRKRQPAELGAGRTVRGPLRNRARRLALNSLDLIS